MTCLSNSHSSLALLIVKTTDMSEALGPVPPANQAHTKGTLPTSGKISEFFEKPPLSEAEKHPYFQVTSCLRFVTTNVDFVYIESE